MLLYQRDFSLAKYYFSAIPVSESDVSSKSVEKAYFSQSRYGMPEAHIIICLGDSSDAIEVQ